MLTILRKDAINFLSVDFPTADFLKRRGWRGGLGSVRLEGPHAPPLAFTPGGTAPQEAGGKHQRSSVSFFASSTSRVSGWSGSGTHASTGQIATHWDES